MEALRAAKQAGYVLSVASGRPLCTVNKSILDAHVMDYAVCTNGATVTRLSDGAQIAHHVLSREDCLDCYHMLAPFHPAWNAFFDGRAFFEWRGASYMLTGRTGAIARTRRYASTTGKPLRAFAQLARRGVRYVWRMVANRGNRQVRSVLPHLRRARGGVDKVGCTIPSAADCERACRLLADDGRFEVVQMSAHELEITQRGVTKGTGAAELMRHLGISREQAVAFGDGGNDLPLAEAVSRFIAVANADAAVREAAFEVCPSVAEDGVAVWIRSNLLG